MEKLIKQLKQKPNASDLSKNKFANNSEFLQVGAVIRDLHDIFGLYQWEILKSEYSLDGKSFFITGRLTVEYDNKQYSFQGIGAHKIGNPHTDIPKVNSYAFKNACKHLGNRFGAYLNKEVSLLGRSEKEHIDFMRDIDNIEDLKEYCAGLQRHEQTPKISGAFKQFKTTLENK